MDVVRVTDVVGFIGNAVIGVATFPHIEFALQSEGKSALDVLDGFFKRNFRRWSQEQMDVIGHDDEGMKLETISGSLFLQNFDEERCVLVDLEEATAGGCGAGYEERP